MPKPPVAVRRLADLVPDARNANAGTERGLRMLDDSLHEDGAGRGILLDRNNNVIAGNKTIERAVDQGFEEIIIVPTDGKQLVATQRIDVDLNSPQGRRMAIRDNRVAEIDLAWDADALKALAEDEKLDLSQFWNDGEMAKLLNQGEELDYGAAWQGMPEFENEPRAIKTLYVHFKTEDDFEEFCKAINQKISLGTKSIWFPKAEQLDSEKLRFQDGA